MSNENTKYNEKFKLNTTFDEAMKFLAKGKKETKNDKKDKPQNDKSNS